MSVQQKLKIQVICAGRLNKKTLYITMLLRQAHWGINVISHTLQTITLLPQYSLHASTVIVPVIVKPAPKTRLETLSLKHPRYSTLPLVAPTNTIAKATTNGYFIVSLGKMSDHYVDHVFIHCALSQMYWFTPSNSLWYNGHLMII